ncbi:Maf family protein [Arcanobacterium bovis]|uniref:Nucleoside triphosphate pyrophosphatase n=1 Tax=Arcanobacterium bovis TaxID=2529275 RepID=A0A4Q9V1Z3_9ACTO|nr:Maf family protein [Arcanobacterium bovis]TBW23651.1 septum formation inhibitor Maf [Arcanobacterium bovis]
MTPRTILLASASPARRTTLINAGITPSIAVSDVDEELLLERLHDSYASTGAQPPAAEQVKLLAQAKAHDVYASLCEGSPVAGVAASAATSVTTATTANPTDADSPAEQENLPTVIIGCDSMLEMNGEVMGKPHTPELTRQRLRSMSGRWGDLHTGHCIIDTATGASVEGVSVARVYIAELSEHEIESYVQSGEPLHVAGSFTVDGLGGSFVEKIEGDYHGVVGISLPLVRALLQQLGHSIVDFWDC